VFFHDLPSLEKWCLWQIAVVLKSVGDLCVSQQQVADTSCVGAKENFTLAPLLKISKPTWVC
jgi:hypothetical protein